MLIAVIVHEKRRPEVLLGSPNAEEPLLDGLESYPVTYFHSHPPMKECPKEFHAEAVMLWDTVTSDTFHMPALSTIVSGPSGGTRRKQGATYFARKLLDNAMVVVCFPRSNREPQDHIVKRFLDRLGRIFVL